MSEIPHIEAVNMTQAAYDELAHRLQNYDALVARVEALEGALRRGYLTSTGGWFIGDGDIARAALAGEPE